MSSHQLNYAVEINNEHIKITSGQNITELSWTEFTSFGINNSTIYVFNKVKPTNLLYWDCDEMGNDNYTALIDLLKQKSIKQAF